MLKARLCAVGTSVPPSRYRQTDLLSELGITDSKIRSLFLRGAIETRHLVLPPADSHGRRTPESEGELLAKHQQWSIKLASAALTKCLSGIGRTASDVDYLCCVTTTGFLSPGVSARLMEHLGMRPDCSRLDVVGMGCNAGLNGLAAVAAWAESHPDKLAVMVCVEVCSAAYVFDGTMRTAVVNSLFGDGAAAVAVHAGQVPQADTLHPTVLLTSSLIILDALEAMRYDWDDNQGLFSFYLDPDIPYIIGAHVETALKQLLARTSLTFLDIDHWLVHSGGKKVIDALRVNLGLSRFDVRHTLGVLRDYGNLSSGSFLFSLDRLQREGSVRRGDYGVMITMGPGSTIEMALVQWT